ncbi:radical SAM protein [Polynucleobacter sp. UB-Tiil-W10]|uniref:B12-binding domain-containing radical SAM protein n=1 Tax=Polynucleobacter sp. UB-Tiil-W10 TaxID=1855648 RepID=UPI001C0E0BEE|nr:radical SAM protein [Polynucleobacter sp. UB-Tiil-W10]MBU3541066.1 radical SAM protein [Polynucleobacter sp. UB-Tiil-W10]
MKVLSLIPPMTQLNTPYPSTAYLTGFLRSRGIDAVQEDLALALVLSFFTPEGMAEIRSEALNIPEENRSASVNFFLDYFDSYRSTISPVIRFLQGRDSTLSHRINTRDFLPEGPRFASLDVFEDEEASDSLAWAFGALGSQDRARHLATLYLNDLSDVLRDAVDDRFEFVRYAESLASSQPTFTPLAEALKASPTLMDLHLQALASNAIECHQPGLVLLSVPFPGAMYAALRIAQVIKGTHPEIKIALGGGYVNTELRELSDSRIFDYVDFITLDSGERPLLALLEHLKGKRSAERLVRTFIRNASNQVQYLNWQEPDVPFEEVGTATWDGLPLDSYLSLLDMLNPMHRLWSDGRWNKLTVAHGCYWKKCSFCDVSLDYISRYETASASLLVDRIEQIVAETGQTGFHFVDEAAPPKVLKALAEELIRRKVLISWWGNIRFEKTFTSELADLLARSGCIAMSGGLEVASDRLLNLMKKGVSVEQVAQVTKGFSDAGILVHAYLMYGFPTQTVQETVDALEYVRQLFENDCIQSGFFHRFICTVHSPVGINPQEYGIELIPLPEITFAKNDVSFIDPTGVDHDALGQGLKKAIYNYMHGVGFDIKAQTWFDGLGMTIPKTTVPKNFIEKVLFQ